MPDIALPTALDSGVNRGLAFCLGTMAPAATGAVACNPVRAGGSAAAAALFAGIAALIAEKNGPQGNLAPRLYKLSRRSGIFDVSICPRRRMKSLIGSSKRACGVAGY